MANYIYKCDYCQTVQESDIELSSKCPQCQRNHFVIIEDNVKKAQYDKLVEGGMSIDKAIAEIENKNYKEYIVTCYFPIKDNRGWNIKELIVWDEESGELLLQEYIAEYDKAKSFTGYGKSIRKVIPPINLKNIETYKDEDGQLYVKDTVLHKFQLAEEYLKEINLSSNYKSWVMQALSLSNVRKSLTKPHGFEVIVEGGKLVVPKKEDMFIEYSETKELADTFKVSADVAWLVKKDQEVWEALSPKQRRDYAAAVGIPLQNIIIGLKKSSLMKTMIEGYGDTQAGKTWVHKLSLRLWWGTIVIRPLMGNAIGSEFRINSVLSSTNFPILIDEAETAKKGIIDVLKAWASGGRNIRGRADQTMKKYNPDATPITTSQDDLFIDAISLVDFMATGRRAYKTHYDTDDKELQRGRHSKGDALLDSILEGGYIFYKLKDYTIDELFDKIYAYHELTDGDTALMGVMLGLEVMGRLKPEYTDSLYWYEEDTELINSLYHVIQGDAERTAGGLIDNYAKELSTKMIIEEDGGKEYMFINSTYISWVNQNKGHALNGRFKNLGALKQFAVLLGCKPIEIYDKERNKRIGGIHGTFARLPLSLPRSTASLSLSLTDKIKNNIDSKVIYVVEGGRHVRPEYTQQLEAISVLYGCVQKLPSLPPQKMVLSSVEGGRPHLNAIFYHLPQQANTNNVLELKTPAQRAQPDQNTNKVLESAQKAIKTKLMESNGQSIILGLESRWDALYKLLPTHTKDQIDAAMAQMERIGDIQEIKQGEWKFNKMATLDTLGTLRTSITPNNSEKQPEVV